MRADHRRTGALSAPDEAYEGRPAVAERGAVEPGTGRAPAGHGGVGAQRLSVRWAKTTTFPWYPVLRE